MATFAPVPTTPDWPALEREILALWRETQAFERLRAKNAGRPRWSFLDGPITANNPMGVHHAWGRTYKDLWQRFKAMQGFDQRYQNGFDCQGLWVEVEVEKELGFHSKHDIEAYGIDRFVRRCKERVLRYAAVQTEQSVRLGMWMRWDDPEELRRLADLLEEDGPVEVDTPDGPVTATAEWLVGQLGHAPWHGSYFTFSDANNDMIWAFLARCHARGWIQQGTDVMPWCARCGTGLSQHEIATEGYQLATHVSPTVRFPLVDRPGESLLVWTTTPWTLAGNVAAAVGPELDYLRVRAAGGEVLYVAEAAAPTALAGGLAAAEVLGRLKGAEMVGWRYRGPFDELPVQDVARDLHRVIGWDEVGAEEGTGIVHIAPGSGAEDFALAKVHGLPAISPLTENGRYREGFGPLTGRDAREATGDVLAHLEAAGLLYRAEPYTHRYPVCWRCGSELVFRLVDEWFISMGPVYDKPRRALTPEEKAASLRYQMMDVVDDVRWIPAFGREREMDWLRNMADWMISKKRYWGLALPIWRCADCGWFDVVGGRDELAERAVSGWDVFAGRSPHRPAVDAVRIRCDACGGLAARIPDVGNPWLDAGIVPFSTLGYRDDPDEWRRWFPADFITESFPGQVRNWFYSLLAMSTVLENAAPFRTVLGYATLFAEDGREMHKSSGNMIEFNEAADAMGADVMRWMYAGHRPEQNLAFGYGPGTEVRRRFLLPLWNVYAFFVQYANVAEGWRPAFGGRAPAAPSAGLWAELDRWIVVRLDEVTSEVTARLEDFDAPPAVAAMEAFLEDLSNWYVRRSRRRFWEGDPAALDTLHHVLVTFSRLLAPFVPFTAEALHQNLARRVDPAAPVSVHLTDWPAPGELGPPERRLLEDMALVMRLAALGRAARAMADLKLRQPLARATVAVRAPEEAEALARLGEHLTQELNVKALEVVADEGALVTYRLRPVLPVLGPRYGPRVQAIRAALQAADAAAVAARVAAGEPVELAVDGETILLAPDELEVRAEPRPGEATAGEGGYVVSVATALTPELVTEGVARDLVRRIQQLRKDAGFEITDRVALTLDAPEPVRRAVEAWRDYVMGETLATSLTFGEATDEGEVEGQAVRIGLLKV